MNILVLDHDEISLKHVKEIMTRLTPQDRVAYASCREKAKEILESFIPDVLLADLTNPRCLLVAKELQMKQPKLNIVITTNRDFDIQELEDIVVSGVIRKPITEEELRKQYTHLRYPMVSLTKAKRKVQDS